MNSVNGSPSRTTAGLATAWTSGAMTSGGRSMITGPEPEPAEPAEPEPEPADPEPTEPDPAEPLPPHHRVALDRPRLHPLQVLQPRGTTGIQLDHLARLQVLELHQPHRRQRGLHRIAHDHRHDLVALRDHRQRLLPSVGQEI